VAVPDEEKILPKLYPMIAINKLSITILVKIAKIQNKIHANTGCEVESRLSVLTSPRFILKVKR
jgi:hypothetical protein